MLRQLYRFAQDRGPWGGSRVWTVMWGALLAVRVLRWLARENTRVLRHDLEPGDALLVRHLLPGESTNGS